MLDRLEEALSDAGLISYYSDLTSALPLWTSLTFH